MWWQARRKILVLARKQNSSHLACSQVNKHKSRVWVVKETTRASWSRALLHHPALSRCNGRRDSVAPCGNLAQHLHIGSLVSPLLKCHHRSYTIQPLHSLGLYIIHVFYFMKIFSWASSQSSQAVLIALVVNICIHAQSYKSFKYSLLSLTWQTS